VYCVKKNVSRLVLSSNVFISALSFLPATTILRTLTHNIKPVQSSPATTTKTCSLFPSLSLPLNGSQILRPRIGALLLLIPLSNTQQGLQYHLTTVVVNTSFTDTLVKYQASSTIKNSLQPYISLSFTSSKPTNIPIINFDSNFKLSFKW